MDVIFGKLRWDGWFFWFIFAILLVSCDQQPKQTHGVFTGNDDTLVSGSKDQMEVDQFISNIVHEMDNRVLSIYQDRNSYYWFGTDAGLYRYNGQTLIKFTVEDGLYQDQVQHIQEDESGNLWFSTGGYGVSRLSEGKITTMKLDHDFDLNKKEEIQWKIGNGDTWFYAGGGAFHYNQDQFEYLPFPMQRNEKENQSLPDESSPYGVYSILKDKNGHLWFGTQSMGVCRYDGKSFTWFTEHGLKGPAVLDIFEDHNGHLWFGTNGNGIFRFDGNTLSNFTEERGLSNPEFIKSGVEKTGSLARVWTICEDNSGNLWMGTGDSGVWSYDGKELINYTTKDGLSKEPIEVMYKDKSGELWLGTNGDGVYKFKDNYFEKLLIP